MSGLYLVVSLVLDVALGIMFYRAWQRAKAESEMAPEREPALPPEPTD